ncbi:MAG TPA: isochorismatase family protein [Bacteroidia bacterium]|nr:isochorismatase family protein [Bacteroidia bacterium]
MITAIDKNTALVLIDLQKGIVKMDVVHPIKNVLDKSAQLVDAFRKAGLPIIAVNVIPTPSNTRNENPVARNAANAAAAMEGFADIVDDIKTQPADIFITKRTWNAFYNTKLHDELQKHNITGIVLAGVATSIGVEGTARAASELGYNISFATDAMTDRVLDAHNHSINIIFPRVGEVGTSANIIAKLSNRV